MSWRRPCGLCRWHRWRRRRPAAARTFSVPLNRCALELGAPPGASLSRLGRRSREVGESSQIDLLSTSEGGVVNYEELELWINQRLLIIRLRRG